MECPCCGAELVYEDYFGRICAHQDGKVLGDIYSCPNGRADDESCDSSSFNVAGSFYVFRDREDDLHEGYPC